MHPNTFDLPFYLTSTNHRCVSIDSSGGISYTLYPSDQCTVWRLFPPPLTVIGGDRPWGYHLVSDRQILLYDESKDEKVFVSPIDSVDGSKATMWNVSPDGEVYTVLQDGLPKYLWTILDGVYVTPDEYLAESWQFVSLDGNDISSNIRPPSDTRWWLWFIIILVIVVVAVYGVYR